MINDKLISIIVPAYNTEKYIKKCIKSVSAQTYKNIQIIIVDDGSTDKTYEICKSMCNEDNRIEVHQKTNGGVSSARNLGIDKAVGQYVAFVDSDDILEAHYIERLVRAMKGDDIKLSVCGYTVLFSGKDNKKRYMGYHPQKCGDYIKPDFIKRISELIDNRIMLAPVAKLYRYEIIQDKRIRFDESRSIGEDLIFNLDYLKSLKETDHINLINQAGYGYFMREGESLTHNFGRERLRNSEELYNYCIDFCSIENAPFLEGTFSKLYLKGLLSYVDSNIVKGKKWKDISHDIDEMFLQNVMQKAISCHAGKDKELMLYKICFALNHKIMIYILSKFRVFVKRNLRGY